MHSVFPKSIEDASFQALEKCIDKAFGIDMSPFMTCIIDKLSGNMLFYKAEQMSLTDGDGYANCTDEKEKRELIKQAIRQHKMKATVKCIKSLLTNEFTYIPWDKYDGIYNHYKLIINLLDSDLTPEKIQKILNVIQNNKRLSAKQDDNYDINSTTKSNINIASRFKTEVIINALPMKE